MDRFAAMEVFVKVVEAGNLSRAATQLGISNATVSTRLQQLEAHLGISLLHRTTRRFGVTEIGLEYYDQCKDILARIDTAEASLDQTVTGLSGSLRVDLPIAMGLFLSPLLVGFSNQHPNLAIRASLTNDVVNLVTNGIDVAVRMDEIDDLDLVARKFHNDPTRYVRRLSFWSVVVNQIPLRN
ncbi:MAG: LysR family transcriptional regulator [Pseudomonadota bacterium]